MQAPKHKVDTSSIPNSDKLHSVHANVLRYMLLVYVHFDAISTQRTDSKKYAAWDGLDRFHFYHQVNNMLCYCLWQISRSTSILNS